MCQPGQARQNARYWAHRPWTVAGPKAEQAPAPHYWASWADINRALTVLLIELYNSISTILIRMCVSHDDTLDVLQFQSRPLTTNKHTANKVNRAVHSSRQPTIEAIVSALPEETPADCALQALALSASPLVRPDACISWATRRLRWYCRYLPPF